MDFKTWQGNIESRGQEYAIRARQIETIFSFTTGEEAAKWTYIKKPFSRYGQEFFVFDGKRIFKIIFGDSDEKLVESWNIKDLNKIFYQKYVPRDVEVSVLSLHIGEDCIRFSNEVDTSENLATTKKWAPVYNERIEALYKMLITQS